MTWDFVLSIILGITIGALICRFTNNKKQEKSVGYELLKEQMNKFHDVLFRTDTVVRKKFISNPNKTDLPKSDTLSILDSISELESMIPLVKQRLIEHLVVPEQSKTTAEEVDTSNTLNKCSWCGGWFKEKDLKRVGSNEKLCDKCFIMSYNKKEVKENDVSEQS